MIRKTLLAGAAFAAVSVLALPPTVFAADEAATPPQIDTSRPHDQIYPMDAQRSGEQGDVYLKVYVHENGKTDRVQIAKSSGYADLDNAAIESVLNWRYIPAKRNGETVDDWTTVHLVYQLPQQAQSSGQK